MGRCPTCGGYIKDSKQHTFESSRKQVKNVAVGSIPEVGGNTNIHNHGTAWPGIIFSGFVCGLIVLPVGWGVGVFLLDRAGFKNPEQALASGILILGIGLPALYWGSYLLERIPQMFIREVGDIKLRLAEIEAETARAFSLTAAQPRPGESRLTDEDKRLCALLRVVMDEAYRHVYRDKDKVQQYTKSDVKPWSREPNFKRVIPGIEGEVSFNMAGNVRQWLTREGVIRKDAINLERYQTFARFEALLEERFYTPIEVKPLSPIVLRNEVSFTD